MKRILAAATRLGLPLWLTLTVAGWTLLPERMLALTPMASLALLLLVGLIFLCTLKALTAVRSLGRTPLTLQLAAWVCFPVAIAISTRTQLLLERLPESDVGLMIWSLCSVGFALSLVVCRFLLELTDRLTPVTVPAIANPHRSAR